MSRADEVIFESEGNPVKLTNNLRLTTYKINENDAISNAKIDVIAAYESFTGSIMKNKCNDSYNSEFLQDRFYRLKEELNDVMNNLQSLHDRAAPVSDKDNIWTSIQKEANEFMVKVNTFESQNLKVQSNIGITSSELKNIKFPELSSSEAVAKLSEPKNADLSYVKLLEERNRQLEETVKALMQENKIGSLSSVQPEELLNRVVAPGIKDAITRLEAHMKSGGSEQFTAHLKSFKHTLEALSSTPNAVQIESVSKLKDLHSKMIQVESVLDDIPAIVQRLKSLDSVHCSAALMKATVSTLEEMTLSLEQKVLSNDTAMKELQSVMKDNLTVFDSHVQQLNDRMKKMNRQQIVIE